MHTRPPARLSLFHPPQPPLPPSSADLCDVDARDLHVRNTLDTAIPPAHLTTYIYICTDLTLHLLPSSKARAPTSMTLHFAQ